MVLYSVGSIDVYSRKVFGAFKSRQVTLLFSVCFLTSFLFLLISIWLSMQLEFMQTCPKSSDSREIAHAKCTGELSWSIVSYRGDPRCGHT